MKVNFKDFRYIKILADQTKDIVIFPIGIVELIDGSDAEFEYNVAYYPIELKYPYTATELAVKIQYGIEQWGMHKCYDDFSGKNTFEEKYYGIKGFKNAVKGNLYFRLGWDDIQGKYVSLLMPLKRGYAYIGLDKTQLSDEADWLDFANAIIEYINMDITKLKTFKTYKSKLNL